MRDTSLTPPTGQIDVFSHGFGQGVPPVTPIHTDSGVFQGAAGPVPYVLQSRDWGAAPPIRATDVIDTVARNVSEVTINPARAQVDCNVALNVQTDGPLLVHFFGCTRPAEQH